MALLTPKRRLTCAMVCLLGLLASCGGRKPDLSTPTRHRSGNLVFEYPKNWSISHDTVSPGLHSLIIETTGDGLAILEAVDSGDPYNLLNYAQDFSNQAAITMPMGKTATASLKELPKVSNFEWMREEFTITALGQSIPHRRLYGSKKMGELRVSLIFQVPTKDFRKEQPGFNLIRDTLRAAEAATLSSPTP